GFLLCAFLCCNNSTGNFTPPNCFLSFVLILNMFRQFLIFILLGTGILNKVSAQNAHFTISGYVKEAASGEALIGATVVIKEIQKGVNTNQYGFYSITVDKGSYTLAVTYLG